LLFVLVMTSCSPAPALPCKECAQARLLNKWCEYCMAGYVAGLPIKSRLLHEVLDAHGHDLDLTTINCPSCKQMIATNGFCETCRMGWLDKRAYFSRLTYELGQGEVKEVETIACPTCRQNSGGHGWCDRCKAGMVGNVRLTGRAGFERARHCYDIMVAANQAAGRCEQCAMAMVTDTLCFPCGILYKDGKPTSTKVVPGIATKSTSR
jgi:hypothetical protein